MKWLDRIPLALVFGLAVVMGLAPFVPEPHLWQKLKLLADGNLDRPIDVFDLVWHGAPSLLLILKLWRIGQRRRLSDVDVASE